MKNLDLDLFAITPEATVLSGKSSSQTNANKKGNKKYYMDI